MGIRAAFVALAVALAALAIDATGPAFAQAGSPPAGMTKEQYDSLEALKSAIAADVRRIEQNPSPARC